MLQIAICDDEQFYRRKIEGLLRTYLDGHGRARFTSLSPGRNFWSRARTV